ncbi:MAG TPA: protease modulator HflC [Planctomycetota bacterium]|jgi:membrane protease subunit HflC|nr:protease modulator HflC [Planctomycetota bacterium]
MRSNTLRWIVGSLAVAITVLSAVTFTVREEHSALVTRFGKPLDEVSAPGLHWKLPWPIERTTTIDRRTRVFNTRHAEVLTRDKKNVILLSYAVWRVADPWSFYRAVGSMEGAANKLEGLIIDAKTGVLGHYDLSALVSTDEELLAVADIEADLLTAVQAKAKETYGIQIDHVGFKRLSLPESNITSVFAQMRAERQRSAAVFRADGDRQAAQVRAEADLEVARILAEASETAAKTRGKAEAEAASVYAAAHGEDEEFYRFVRQLEALETLLGTGATIILRTDSAPFGLLEAPTLPVPGGEDQEQGDRGQ